MPVRAVRFIVIHHPGIDHLDLPIEQYIHPPFTDVPYDWLVRYSGDVVKGRPLSKRGAHVIPDYANWKHVNNDTAIGVALEGNFDNDTPPIGPGPLQLERASALVGHLCAEWSIHPVNVLPHRQVSRTACPGRHFMAIWDQFIGKVKFYYLFALKDGEV